jgi:glycine/D-amino acid oxidase-like deaminating enzyme/nitrite reductase/ring-hydroxylating ferredoxin subunit
MPTYPPIHETLRTDVGIVGAGISGLTTAYLLLQAGKSVVVIDDGQIGGGMTQLTTAHLSCALDAGYLEIERLHGAEGARLAAESHLSAIHRIEHIVRREKIDCDFQRVDGYLFLGPDDTEERLDKELAAIHRAGLTDVEKHARAPLDFFNTGPCLRYRNQAQFHPLRYLVALAEAVERMGGQIYGQTHAGEIQGGASVRIRAGEKTILADAVVVATNTPINDLVAVHTKQAPYMTYVIAARIPSGSVPVALYWDTNDPYHYVRVQPGQGHDLLIIGGEDHKSGQAADAPARQMRLIEWGKERFPMMEAVDFRWGGQVMESIDGLAYIGRNPMDRGNVYIATGDSGMGMTHGTIAGMLLTDLIMDRQNSWKSVYDPSRIRILSTGEFAKEAFNMAAQYADWVTGGEVESPDQVPPLAGAVMRRGLHKVALYRDEAGVLHERSAVCPHLGCIVKWNRATRTWDCPCHGSRFDCTGKVINGPANTDLAQPGAKRRIASSREKPPPESQL